MSAGLYESAPKGSPRRRQIRNRALELLKTHDKWQAVEVLRAETGLNITVQAVSNWNVASKRTAPHKSYVRTEMTQKEVDALRDVDCRQQQAIAALPHRCGTCRGISTGEECQWCGTPF